jgi:hypothetical protein
MAQVVFDVSIRRYKGRGVGTLNLKRHHCPQGLDGLRDEDKLFGELTSNEAGPEHPGQSSLWSAPAERSVDGALDC